MSRLRASINAVTRSVDIGGMRPGRTSLEGIRPSVVTSHHPPDPAVQRSLHVQLERLQPRPGDILLARARGQADMDEVAANLAAAGKAANLQGQRIAVILLREGESIESLTDDQLAAVGLYRKHRR